MAPRTYDADSLARTVRRLGVVGALRAGITSDQITDRELRYWWSLAEKSFADLKPSLWTLERRLGVRTEDRAA